MSLASGALVTHATEISLLRSLVASQQQRIFQQPVGVHVEMTAVESSLYCYFQPSNKTLQDNSKNPGSWFQEITFEGQCSPNFTIEFSNFFVNANTTIRKPSFLFLQESC